MAFDMLLLDKEGWTLKILLAIFLVVIGILIGRVVSLLLRKISEKVGLEKKIRSSIIALFLFIIRWSIYLLFINFAIRVLDIALLTEMLTKVILVMPALTGGIALLILGFGAALLLRNVINDLNIPEKGVLLAEACFYFIWYVFGLYALKTALTSIDTAIRNYIILIWTAAVAIGVILYSYKADKILLHSK